MSFFNFLYFTMTNIGLAQTVGEKHTYNVDMHGMSVNYNVDVKCPNISINPQICYHSRPNETISEEDLADNLILALRHLSDASDMAFSIANGMKDAMEKNGIKEASGGENTGDCNPSSKVHSGVGNNSGEDKVGEKNLSVSGNSTKQEHASKEKSEDKNLKTPKDFLQEANRLTEQVKMIASSEQMGNMFQALQAFCNQNNMKGQKLEKNESNKPKNKNIFDGPVASTSNAPEETRLADPEKEVKTKNEVPENQRKEDVEMSGKRQEGGNSVSEREDSSSFE